jgi:hypothetical protein
LPAFSATSEREHGSLARDERAASSVYIGSAVHVELAICVESDLDFNWSAADRAILDVLLMLDRVVDDQFDGFPAIGA